MRISDWSSDVCASDLKRGAPGGFGVVGKLVPEARGRILAQIAELLHDDLPKSRWRTGCGYCIGVAGFLCARTVFKKTKATDIRVGRFVVCRVNPGAMAGAGPGSNYMAIRPSF